MTRRITRGEFLKTTVVGAGSALLAGFATRANAFRVSAQGPPLDLVIKGGRVIDGTGKAPFAAAIGIRDGRIADIGEIPDAGARQVIDARGQVVCPGFIDPHAHEEILMIADPILEKFLRQGVTTLINGNCGHSVTPYRAKTVLEYWWREALISKERSQMAIDWEGVDGYAEVLDRRGGATVNSAVLLGYGGIRWGAMKGGHDRPPTADEWKEIERLVNEGLEEGAVGMSTGLSYRPCAYASTDELVRVAKILAKHQATYASHTRFGAPGDPTGGLEAIEIGEKGGCRVQISHFRGRSKAALEMVTAAYGRGLQVAADVIPQSVSHRRRSDRMVEALMVFYPGVFDHSEAQLEAMLRDKATRAEIVKKVSFFNNDKSQVVVVRALTDKHKPHLGQSVAQIAASMNKDPHDLYVEMVLDRDHPVVFTFDGNRPDGRRGEQESRRPDAEVPLPEGYWTTHPRFGPGSDSIPVDADDPYGWYEHQRRGAFCGYLKQAKSHEVPLETAIRKATALPAEMFGLTDRGVLAKGKAADVCVFDPDSYSFPSPEESDVNDPFPLAKGVSAVVVNGVTVLSGANLTGARPGRVLL